MKTYKDIIDHYGVKAQKQMAIEEMSELIKEICKDFRGLLNRDHIVEEIADVQIMLWQIREIYDIDAAEMARMIDYKLKRTADRIDAEDRDPLWIRDDG